MFFSKLITAAIAACVFAAQAVTAQNVFAHFIVGNSYGMTVDDWITNFQAAQKVGIDAFALNIGYNDPQNAAQIPNAFTAAQSVSGFKLFFSFDYAALGAWPAGSVVQLIQQYGPNEGYFLYQGKPFVSTFSGDANAGDWAGIKAQTPVYFVPDWSDVSPTNFVALTAATDGAFNWDAWSDGPTAKPLSDDTAWIAALAGKSYMMPVSPLFYTNLPQYAKNWMWTGDTLWIDRWRQVLQVKPAFVEIITWNDYGESHYIGPISAAGIPEGAARYVTGYEHSGLIDSLTDFIKAYKAGESTVTTVTEPGTVFWYRTHPAGSGNVQGTTGNDPAYQSTYSPAQMTFDAIYILTASNTGGTVTCTIGDSTVELASQAGVHYVQCPFTGKSGAVSVSFKDAAGTYSAAGPLPISTAPADGLTNLNVVVGSSYSS
jgi:hypothetical protein